MIPTIQTICLKSIAMQLCLKMQNEDSTVTCCHCIFSITNIINRLIEQDSCIINSRKHFSILTHNKAYQFAISLFIHEQLSMDAPLFHECFFFEINKKKVYESINNFYLTQLYHEVNKRIKLRHVKNMVVAFWKAYDIQNSIDAKDSLFYLYTTTFSELKYSDAKIVHQCILEQSHEYALKYKALINL